MSEDPKKEPPAEPSVQELNDDELDQVAGGARPVKVDLFPPSPPTGPVPIPYPNISK